MVGYWGYSIDKKQAAIENNISTQKITLEKRQQEFYELKIKNEAELSRLKTLNESLSKKEDQLIAKLAVLEKLIPHISKDPKSRKVALIALARLGDNELALELSGIFPDQESKEAGDIISQYSESPEQKAKPQQSSSSQIASSKSIKKGWIYLGRFDNNKWYGNYVNLHEHKSLSSVKDKIVKVKENITGLNVRTDHPTPFLGRLKPVITTLTPGSEIRIGKYHHFTFNDYIWVNIEYSDE